MNMVILKYFLVLFIEIKVFFKLNRKFVQYNKIKSYLCRYIDYDLVNFGILVDKCDKMFQVYKFFILCFIKVVYYFMVDFDCRNW